MSNTYHLFGVIYGLPRIAELWGVNLSTARRWLHAPEAACFAVGSMDNTGGGYGYGWYGQVNSLMALKEHMLEERRLHAAAAARQRWAYPQVSLSAVGGLSLGAGSYDVVSLPDR